MNINEKITLKGITSNIKLLIKSNFLICEVNNAPELQIPINNFNVISINNKLFVHKHIIGSYFTYKVSSSLTDPFYYDKNYGEYKIRSGNRGIITILNIKNYFN